MTTPRTTDPNHDNIFLIRPIFTIVADKCLEAYLPHKECSVDEAMIAFRGRLGFQQHLPAKPVKCGIKVWVRSDSRSRYVNELYVYVGKPPRKEREIRLGKKVALKLTRNLLLVVKIIITFCLIAIFTVWNSRGAFCKETFWVWYSAR